MISVGIPTNSFAQSARDLGGVSASRTSSHRLQTRGNDGGNEIATVVPYMVIMAVFLGGGIYSFAANRSSIRGGE